MHQNMQHKVGLTRDQTRPDLRMDPIRVHLWCLFCSLVYATV